MASVAWIIHADGSAAAPNQTLPDNVVGPDPSAFNRMCTTWPGT